MSTTEHARPPHAGHQAAIEAGEEAFAVTGGGLRIVEIAIVAVIGLLVCPPLAILTVVVAVPVIAAVAVFAAVAAVVAGPVWLVRRVRAHHHEHGTTLFLHRLKP